MSTYLAKAVSGQPRGSGAQQHNQHAGGGLQHNDAVKSNPVRQTVGFSVSNNSDRLGFIGNVLLGYKVEVQVTSGFVYEGVFGSLQNDPSGVVFVLKYVKIVKDPKAAADRNTLAEKPVPVLTIPAADLVQLIARDVRFSPEDLSGADRSDVGFETDAAIARGRGGCVRELQKWLPDEGENSALFSLEATNDSTGWDQFAVNRDRFGVKTTWNEHFYTTKINPDECRISEAEAERIANEIEKGGAATTTNIHLLEERGGELSVDVDEEALYGAVIRDPQPSPYQHSHHHHHQHHQQHHQQHHHQQQRQQQRTRAPQASAPERMAAWGRAGSGVAAVAGGLSTAQQQQQQQQQQQRGAVSGGTPATKAPTVSLPLPTATASSSGAGPTLDTGGGSSGSSGTVGGTAPIDIDARKEVNKVRSSLTTWPKKDRSSPFGTPRLGMSRSPVFASPLVGDPVSFSALDLDPGAPQQVRLDPEAQAEFLRFKEEQNKKRSGQTGAEAALADFKKSASSSFKERVPAVTGNGTAGAPVGSEAAVAAPAALAAFPIDGQPVATAATASPASTAPAAPVTQAAVVGSVAAAVAAAVTTRPLAASDTVEAKSKMMSKLNPNARPFSLNIYAKEFVPFAMKPATAPVAPPVAAPVSVVAPAAAITVYSGNVSTVAVTAAPSPVAPVMAAVTTVAAAPATSAAAITPNASAAPPSAASATQAAATALTTNAGQATYGPVVGAHGLALSYHHTSGPHGHGHGHGGAQGQYVHAGQGSLHLSHGHGNLHHERGYGPMGREHSGGMYPRGGDAFRPVAADGSGYRGGGDPFRTGAASGSGDGYHHQHQHHHHQHHKATGAVGGSEHLMVKGADLHGSSGGGPHKIPPPPPQGPMTADGPMMVNGVGPATLGPHVISAMGPVTSGGMPPMGYGMVLQTPGGGYVTSAMPPGTVAIPATTSGGMHITCGGMPIYMARSSAGGPLTAMTPGLAMMGSPYGHAVGPYMSAAPGTMPPHSPTGRQPATGYFQPTGTYSMIATSHPGGPHGHPGGPMGASPIHIMTGPGGHGHPHMPSHLQDGRGPMGPGGPKGGGRQGGRPPRMDHDRGGHMVRADLD